MGELIMTPIRTYLAPKPAWWEPLVVPPFILSPVSCILYSALLFGKTNPIFATFFVSLMLLSLVPASGYAKNYIFVIFQKQTQFKPNQTQFLPSAALAKEAKPNPYPPGRANRMPPNCVRRQKKSAPRLLPTVKRPEAVEPKLISIV
jgi:hypothetical protein